MDDDQVLVLNELILSSLENEVSDLKSWLKALLERNVDAWYLSNPPPISYKYLHENPKVNLS